MSCSDGTIDKQSPSRKWISQTEICESDREPMRESLSLFLRYRIKVPIAIMDAIPAYRHFIIKNRQTSKSMDPIGPEAIVDEPVAPSEVIADLMDTALQWTGFENAVTLKCNRIVGFGTFEELGPMNEKFSRDLANSLGCHTEGDGQFGICQFK